MNDMRSTDDLERELRGADRHLAGGPDLDLIRRHGRRRRQARTALVAGGGLLATAVLAGVGVSLAGLGGDDDGREGAPASVTLQENKVPTTMHPLAARALREIPGAVQVSPTQVVIPGPGVAEEFEEAIGEGERPPLVGTPVPLPGHVYAGITLFPAGSFPDWLHEGVDAFEETELAQEDGSRPVGSTDIGILVDVGVGQLGCTVWHSSEPHANASCSPAVMHQLKDKRYLNWSMGTDSFLTPTAPMEVFLSEDYSTGRRTTLAIAGIDGTDVARVEFVPTSGAPVAGTVQSGTITQGDSFFYANVPGTLWKVVAYAADGTVIEDHPLSDCDDPVDCEVR